MSFFRHTLFFFLVLFLGLGQSFAKQQQGEYFYRNFWSPKYHIQRLDYCSVDGNHCGLSVANRYCKMMGYEKASEALIDYNVGLTNYLLSRKQCQGWTCNGFMLITCVGHFAPKTEQQSYYRSQRFVFPRFDRYRVDWCYQNGRDCGQRAAHSFCRRMGYMTVQHYHKDEHVAATKALGNHRLCFGESCSGFSSITCYR